MCVTVVHSFRLNVNYFILLEMKSIEEIQYLSLRLMAERTKYVMFCLSVSQSVCLSVSIEWDVQCIIKYSSTVTSAQLLIPQKFNFKKVN